MALWDGRFQEGVEAFTQQFGASLETDKHMALHDIEGSRAHARVLAEQGVISTEDAEAIDAGLTEIADEIRNGRFVWNIDDEDVHMAVESSLIARIGAAGARLHTGRSRNDQVALDVRMLARELATELMEGNVALRTTLLEIAGAHVETIMPGYTHLQHAQPVSFAHHMLAYFWMLTRDHTRLQAAYTAANSSPLGAAALAGTTYPLNRHRTAELLGFSEVIPNSLDAVSDRDYLMDLVYACSVSMMHLSRLAEEIILWSSQEFGFIVLSDAFSTGSSIMPQKKNPDFAELIRGKSGRVYGDLMSLLTIMKSLPLAYNKDLQETKEAPLDAAHTLSDCYRIMDGMLAGMKVQKDVMYQQSSRGFTAATDVADYLAKKGMPFREAHRVVGELVLLCEQRGCELEGLTSEDFAQASELFGEDIVEALDPLNIANARTTYGGCGAAVVLVQLEEARTQLTRDTNERPAR